MKSLSSEIVNSVNNPVAFKNAWADVVSMLSGKYGVLTYFPFEGIDERMEVNVTNNFYIGRMLTGVEGNVKIVAPFNTPIPSVLNISTVDINNVITSVESYILVKDSATTPSITLDLSQGRKLLEISGIAK